MAMKSLGRKAARIFALCAASAGCGDSGTTAPAGSEANNATTAGTGTAAAAGASATKPAQTGAASAGTKAQPAAGGTPAAMSGTTPTTAATSGSAGTAAAAAGAMSSGSAAQAGAGGAADSIPASAGTGAAAGAGGSASSTAPGQSILPPIEDPAMPGPFGFEQVPTAEGLTTHTLFVPGKLGDGGVKHPILVWMNGATGSTSFYQNMLEHFASHGFFVVADKMSGGNHDPEIVEQDVAIDWVLAEAARSDSPYFGKIDPERLGIAGHSLGSVGSFANTGHAAVKSSIHWSGGLTGNPVGADDSWLQLIKAPAAFLCGGAEPRALPRCSGDFDNAPAGVPIFYGTIEGVGHTDVFGERNGGQWGRAAIAWWRLTLAGDESFRSWFNGPDCELCAAPWMGKSKGF
jgi:hypothetical protein